MNEKFKELIEKNNGLLSTGEMLNVGLSKYNIKSLENENIIERVGKGIYYHKDYFHDMMKVYQINNSNLIYSNETALYLLNLTDRYPRAYSVTTKSGYHLRKNDELKVYYVKEEFLNLGVIDITNQSGNVVQTYDAERTICDIIINKNRIELQVYIEGIQNYFSSSKSNLNKLAKYAKILGVSKKVNEVSQLFMKP